MYLFSGGQGKIHSLSVDLCSSEPCHTVANTVYTVKVNFTASVGSKSLRNVLHIIFAGVPLPWNINPTDACGNRVHCPLQRGLAQVFTVTVETPKLLEFSGGIVGKWEVKDENDRNVMCIAYGVVFNA